MTQVNKTFKYAQKGKWVNLIFLLIVIVITIWFAVFNFFLEKDIINIQTKVDEHKVLIKELESQKKVHVFSLMTLHKSTLAQMDERSNITKYIEHLDIMKDHYNVEIRWFKMWNGTIASKVKFESNDTGIAYKKAARFISDYRKDENSLLDLEFISTLVWNENEIKFPVLFTLKK